MSGQHLVAAAESASFANKGTDSDLVGRAFGSEPNIDFCNHLSKQRNVDCLPKITYPEDVELPSTLRQ